MTAKHNNALAFIKSIFIYPSIQKYFKKRIQTNKNGRQHHATCQNYFLIGK